VKYVVVVFAKMLRIPFSISAGNTLPTQKSLSFFVTELTYTVCLVDQAKQSTKKTTANLAILLVTFL